MGTTKRVVGVGVGAVLLAVVAWAASAEKAEARPPAGPAPAVQAEMTDQGVQPIPQDLMSAYRGLLQDGRIKEAKMLAERMAVGAAPAAHPPTPPSWPSAVLAETLLRT